MLKILVLALGAAVFPTLLACVVVMLTRPHPRRLLIGFVAGGWCTSLIAGFAILDAFKSSGEVLGSSSTVGPGASIVAGVLCLGAAFLVGTDRGRAEAARLRAKRPPKNPGKVPWAERVLARGSVPIAFGVGAVINMPGPFYLLALAEIADGGYSPAAEVALVIAFNAIMFSLAEIPLLGYIFRPERTTELVHRLRAFLTRNVRRIVTAIALIAGVYLIGEGVAGLL